MTKILLLPIHQDNSALPQSVHTVNDRVGAPNGIYRLAHFVENKGHQADVFDPNVESNPHEKLINLIKENNYDLIGGSTSHMSLHNDLFLSHLVKRHFPSTPYIMGGQEATFNSELIAKKGNVDFLVAGEGEIPLLDMANRYKRFSFDALNRIKIDFSNIKGVSTILDNEIRRTNKNDCLDEKTFVESVMGMDYSKIPFEKYWDASGMNNISAYTSNYCPAGCNFCSSSKFLEFATGKGVKLTSISAQDMFELVYLKIAKRSGVQSFYLTDDNALVGHNQKVALEEKLSELDYMINQTNESFDSIKNKQLNLLVNDFRMKLVGDQAKFKERLAKNLITRMNDYCDMVIKNIKPSQRLPTIVQSRMDNVPLELFKKMNQAGVYMVGFGKETYSELAARLLNKNVNEETATKTYFKALEAGLTPFINIMHVPPLSTTDCAFYNIKVLEKVLNTGSGVGLYPQIIPFKGTYFGTNEPFVSDSIKYNLPVGDTGISIEMPYKVRVYSEEASFYLGLDQKQLISLQKNQLNDSADRDEFEYQQDWIKEYLGMSVEQVLSMNKKDLDDLKLNKVQALPAESKFNHELEELLSRTEEKSLYFHDQIKQDHLEITGKELTKFHGSYGAIVHIISFLSVADEMKIDYRNEYDCNVSPKSLYNKCFIEGLSKKA